MANRRWVTVWRVLVGLVAVGFAVLAYVYVTLPDVRSLATDNPTSTAWMRLREDEAAKQGKTLRHVQRWVPYSRISPSLKRAVLVAEDDAFFQHEGIDYVQLRKSIETDLARGRAVRGASTITQQLAKNLYLSPARDPLRKLKEWIIARRLEAALSKQRIFEIYLNVIEWGDGIWGVEAASRTYFGVSAAALGPSQSALLAGAIVNPRRLSPARPTRRLRNRQAIILARMGGATGKSLDEEDAEADEPSASEPPAVAPTSPSTKPDGAPAPSGPAPSESAPAGEPPAGSAGEAPPS